MSAPEQPTPEQLVEELRRISVADLLVNTCSLLASLGYGKLAAETRDLDQVQLAIEALRALAPVLPEDARRDVQQAVASLQLAFAEAVAPPAGDEAAESPGEQPADPA